MSDNRDAQALWADMVPRLKELAALEHSASEIADILNEEFGAMLTRNAVIGKRARMFGRRLPVVNLVRKRQLAQKQQQQPQEPPPQRRGVHIMDLTSGQCRYMEGPASSLLYCGKPTAGGVSWCPRHLEVVYGKSNVRS